MCVYVQAAGASPDRQDTCVHVGVILVIRGDTCVYPGCNVWCMEGWPAWMAGIWIVSQNIRRLIAYT